MSAVGRPVHEIRHVVRDASPWVRVLARAGFGARGVLSCTIGLLAAMAASGHGGATTDSKGAMRAIQEQPFGKLLLVIVTIGMFGYAVWLFVQALLDPERTAKRGASGVLQRVGRFAAGLLHTGLGVYAIGLLTGVALGRDGDGTKDWTARLLGWDGIGIVIVSAFGLGAIAFGAFDLWRAYSVKLDRRLDLSRLRSRARSTVVQLCRFGVAARAVVFGMIGAFLILAAVRTNPQNAKGLGETLATIQRASFGWLLLGIVALGFVAYGVYQFVEARYRHIDAG